MPDTPLSFFTRLWFAWACFFQVLFDGAFAARVWKVREAAELPPSTEPKPSELEARPKKKAPSLPPPPSPTAALQLLALLQREGRFIDFLEQDVAAFPDADIGAAARVVHDGCRKALKDHVRVAPVRQEPEGQRVVLEDGFDAAAVKLTGNVQGSAPYRGVLRHKGWRATEVTLPTPIEGHDPNVLAPAEVEL